MGTAWDWADTLSKLTDPAVRNATRTGLHADGAGLYLSVTAKKAEGFSKSWLVRYTAPNGKRREQGLGSYPEITLAAARRIASAKREQARSGIDPIEVEHQARREAAREAAHAVSFRECAEAYLAANEGQWRNDKHRKQWRATLLTYAYPIFGDVSVSQIDTALVTRALDPIWTTKAETARRVRGRIETVLDWATVRGHREGPNPARWRGHLDKAMPKVSKASRVKHHAALPFADMPTFMTTLRRATGSSALALEFTILTAARTSEVLGARWSEIDLARRVWTVPAARMKTAREHRVPLSSAAIAVLDVLRPITDDVRSDVYHGERHIFVGGKREGALSNMALLMTLRRMRRSDLTAHGFRSTFRDWTSEKTNFPGEVAEAALSHAISDRVEAAYRRGDLFEKRRHLMAAWGAYCLGAVKEKAT